MAERLRVTLHAGYHKTGTTSVQTFLRENAKRLWPHMAMAQNHGLRDLIQVTRAYSLWRDPISAAQIEDRFGAYLSKVDFGKRRDLLISAEELSGLLPGLPPKRERPEVEAYDAAPELIGILAGTIRARLGEDTDIHVVHGIRQPDAWLGSVYWQHVKTQRMVMNETAFRERFRAAADLAEVSGAIARANPGVHVRTFSVEATSALPLGPAEPILRLARVPDDILASCTAPRRANVSPPAEILEQMLDLNRSDLGDAALRDRKKALLAEWGGAE